MVDDHLQCSEEFSNEDEFISQTVAENNDPANVPDVEQEEYVDSCNVKPTTIASMSSIKILHTFYEREADEKTFFKI